MAKRCFFVLGCVLVVACSDDTSESDTGGGNEDAAVDTAGTPDQGVDQAVPDVLGPDLVMTKKLTDQHTGWKQALCFDCHGTTGTYPHSSESYTPPDCAECHGYNGATHPTHGFGVGSCSNCHSNSHGGSFTEPDDCMACHFHPGQ